MGETKMSSINEEQTETVDEHFEELLNDNTPISLTDWKVTPENKPDWCDTDLFKKAQDYYKCHILGYTAAALFGLIDILAVPSILKVLIFTKKSGTPCTAFKRYAKTVLHAHMIYSQNMDEDPNSKFFKSLTTLRWKHCMASKFCRNAHHEEITNRDLAITQFGFMGYILLKPEEFGFVENREEQESVIHFWRVIGHLIGIPDRLNICRKNVEETIQLCKKIMDEVTTKYVRENPPYFREMAMVMLEGISCIDFTTNPEATFALLHHLHEIPYDGQLNLYSRFNWRYHEIVFRLCRMPMIGYFTRSFYNVLLKMAFWIIDGTPFIAWYRFGRENTRFNLHPNIPS